MCPTVKKLAELSSRSTEARQLWPDFAKGLGILVVVLVHTVDGLKTPGIMPADSEWNYWSILIHTFQVPVFFFISGLFSDRSYENAGFRKFLQNKVELIAYPYVVWQTIQILLMLAAGNTTNKPSAELLLMFPILPYMQFWFIYTLILVFALYSVLKLARLPSLAIFAMSVGMLFLPQIDWIPFNDLCRSMIFFTFGLVLRDYMRVLHDVSSWLLFLAAAACASVTMTMVYNGTNLYTPFRPVAATTGVAASVFFATAMVRWPWWRGLCVIGRYSLEIYVSHLVFAASMRIILMRVFHVESLPLHISLGFMAGVCGPLLLVTIQQMPAGFHIPLFRARSATA
jgi:fucose 4-O-acetylase-like acetyltransferase